MDPAAEIARAIFAKDAEAIYAAYAKILRKGSPYAFQVLSERAFGKVKETHQVVISPYEDLSHEDLATQIKRLEEQLGYRKPEVLSEPEILLPVSGDSKPN